MSSLTEKTLGLQNNHEVQTSRQAGRNKEMDIHKIWAEYKCKPRKQVVANLDSRQGMTA